jgi:hypothetical protein
MNCEIKASGGVFKTAYRWPLAVDRGNKCQIA